MDGSALEHSDSDSGESWTLLENTPSYADEAPEFANNLPKPGDAAENIDKDEDTDGISIISDSEPESTTPCDISYERCMLEESHPTEQQIPNFVSVNPIPSNNNKVDQESVRDEDDFLGDNNGKLKTYVHRRNKRLSTVLNIIVLGSVITAAGVAIGHMWGVRNECSMQTTPSVNKILSNLYKLQEENAFLRNKIKELTLMSNIQMYQKKLENDKLPFKPHRCKKVFEESLNNQNANKLPKCVDNESHAEKLLDNHIESEYEKEFLNDLDKLRNVYQQNKSWLDEEIARRIKHEEQSIKKLRTNLKSPKSIRINEEQQIMKDEKTGFKRQQEPTSDALVTAETVINVTELVQPVLTAFEGITNLKDVPEKRITYADSLKSDHMVKKRDNNKVNTESRLREYIRKRKPVKDDTLSEHSVSEDELKKDNRYNIHKFKPERKKNDRHKIYKKQKRRNKYEQWEMKGGYMKDYDDFSVTSSQENEFVLKNPDKNPLSRDFERNNYINQFSETEESAKATVASEGVEHKVKSDIRTLKRDKATGKKEKEMNWYEKRAALRTEARKKLEQELFGETTPNNAGWYFRRMQRREQCRIKGDNSTYKKLSKRIMNFKTKH